MVFNKTGKLIKRNFFLGNDKVESVRSYKYLGFMITPSGEINTGIKDLKSRAIFALTQLRRNLGKEFRTDVSTTIYLFNSLIKPIIQYISDFWGSLVSPINNPIAIIQNKFLKQLRGTQQ